MGKYTQQYDMPTLLPNFDYTNCQKQQASKNIVEVLSIPKEMYRWYQRNYEYILMLNVN